MSTNLSLLRIAVDGHRSAAGHISRIQDEAPRIFRKLRNDVLGWTQERMATALGVDPAYLSRIENGKVRPGIELLESLDNLVKKHRIT